MTVNPARIAPQQITSKGSSTTSDEFGENLLEVPMNRIQPYPHTVKQESKT